MGRNRKNFDLPLSKRCANSQCGLEFHRRLDQRDRDWERQIYCCDKCGKAKHHAYYRKVRQLRRAEPPPEPPAKPKPVAIDRTDYGTLRQHDNPPPPHLARFILARVMQGSAWR